MPQVQKIEIAQNALFDETALLASNPCDNFDEELEQADNGYRNADLILGEKELLIEKFYRSCVDELRAAV